MKIFDSTDNKDISYIQNKIVLGKHFDTKEDVKSQKGKTEDYNVQWKKNEPKRLVKETIHNKKRIRKMLNKMPKRSKYYNILGKDSGSNDTITGLNEFSKLKGFFSRDTKFFTDINICVLLTSKHIILDTIDEILNDSDNFEIYNIIDDLIVGANNDDIIELHNKLVSDAYMNALNKIYHWLLIDLQNSLKNNIDNINSKKVKYLVNKAYEAEIVISKIRSKYNSVRSIDKHSIINFNFP